MVGGVCCRDDGVTEERVVVLASRGVPARRRVPVVGSPCKDVPEGSTTQRRSRPRKLRIPRGNITIERADLLTAIAAEDPHPHQLAQLRIDTTAMFDRQIADAAAGVEEGVGDEGGGRARLHRTT